jgi:phospholipid transport system transporter-binding protein
MSAAIRRTDEGRLAVVGDMTLETASDLLAAGIAALGKDAAVQFDLSSVGNADSSGLAVLFGWQRAAKERGGELLVVNMPGSLTSLAEVYDVADLLPKT